ncbi:MAG: hypothetical protein DCC58_01010 [Chloroflexi bacterium]|nr:MAG: hypothetical protein DCC58_01010 [Chloroflexota bacterium]
MTRHRLHLAIATALERLRVVETVEERGYQRCRSLAVGRLQQEDSSVPVILRPRIVHCLL